MLLYVLESNGSSPGRQGFGMAVNETGQMVGSIGGGIMEHKFVEMAKTYLREAAIQQPPIVQLKKQVHDKEAAANQSGMICSGDQTNFLYNVQSSDADAINDLLQSLTANKNGSLELSPAGIRFSNSTPAENYYFQKQSEANWLYKEKTGYKQKLYIIGGGHCSLALSKMMEGMNFYTQVFDERANLNTLMANNFVHQKTIVDDYAELENLIPSGADHFVVLMTFGYRTDDKAIRALLKKDFKYFGVLGSKKKMEKMFSDYIAEGISEERLQRLHAPIGLAIHSQTPEEIAVSIAAQIIDVKNKL